MGSEFLCSVFDAPSPQPLSWVHLKQLSQEGGGLGGEGGGDTEWDVGADSSRVARQHSLREEREQDRLLTILRTYRVKC